MNPKPGAPAFPLPPIFSAVRNGMKIYVAPRAGLPLVSLHLIFPYGAETDPPGKAGLADLDGRNADLRDPPAYRRADRRRSGRSRSLAVRACRLGCNRSSPSGAQGGPGSAPRTASRNGRRTVLSGRGVRPAPAAPRGRPRPAKRRIPNRRRRTLRGNSLPGHPLRSPVYGTLKTVPLISRDETQDFYRRDPCRKAAFGSWRRCGSGRLFPPRGGEIFVLTPGPTQASPFNRPRPRDQNFSHRPPGSDPEPDSSRPLGNPPRPPGPLSLRGDELHPGGGGFSSRLMQRIRVELGLTYGIRSSLDLRRQAGPFAVATFTPTATTFGCVAGKLSILKSFRAEGTSKKERDEAVQFLRGSYPFEVRDPGPGGPKDSANGDIWTGNRFPEDYPKKIDATGKGYSSLRPGASRSRKSGHRHRGASEGVSPRFRTVGPVEVLK